MNDLWRRLNGGMRELDRHLAPFLRSQRDIELRLHPRTLQDLIRAMPMEVAQMPSATHVYGARIVRDETMEPGAMVLRFEVKC